MPLQEICERRFKHRKAIIFLLENASQSVYPFLQKNKKYRHIIFATTKIKKNRYLKWVYLQIIKFVFLQQRSNVEYIFCDSIFFLPILKIAKKYDTNIPIICVHNHHFLQRLSILKEFIALSTLFISRDKKLITAMEITSSRFIFIDTELMTIPQEKIAEIVSNKKKQTSNSIKKWALFFGISQKKAFNYFFFWWKQHYKPAPGYNYFLLLNPDQKINIDQNPLCRLVNQKEPLPYKVNVVPIQNVPDVNKKVALHIHLYYPEFGKEIYQHLCKIQIHMDIFITTTDPKNIPYIQKIFALYGNGKITITAVANRGRNLSAFLCYHQMEYKNYEYVGHIHTKKSAALKTKHSTLWRKFLFAHLINAQVLKSIFFLFEQNKKLGLLFPEDPRLPGWSSTENKKIAQQLMGKISPNYEIPHYIEFPIGAMFWARYDAIASLFELKLELKDFPEEPLPIDGTIAHTIERIFPCVCVCNGFIWETLRTKGAKIKKLRSK